MTKIPDTPDALPDDGDDAVGLGTGFDPSPGTSVWMVTMVVLLLVGALIVS